MWNLPRCELFEEINFSTVPMYSIKKCPRKLFQYIKSSSCGHIRCDPDTSWSSQRLAYACFVPHSLKKMAKAKTFCSNSCEGLHLQMIIPASLLKLYRLWGFVHRSSSSLFTDGLTFKFRRTAALQFCNGNRMKFHPCLLNME